MASRPRGSFRHERRGREGPRWPSRGVDPGERRWLHADRPIPLTAEEGSRTPPLPPLRHDAAHRWRDERVLGYRRMSVLVGTMLSRFDDYPIHQTPEPVSHPGATDRNVYDRYWFNGFADDGEFYFGLGLAVYPNRQIMDCGFSIVRGGEQHAFHASRRAPAERGETQVGPLNLEVVEPMRQVRVTLAPNETGIECALTFSARTACIEEGRQTMRREGRIVMDATRFTQFGRWEGAISYDGRRVAIDPRRVYGTKDRSWGIRPVGEPEMGGAPARALPQIFFLWAPIQWGEFCTHAGVFEDADGRAWHVISRCTGANLLG
jgi:hypothetical protein